MNSAFIENNSPSRNFLSRKVSWGAKSGLTILALLLLSSCASITIGHRSVDTAVTDLRQDVLSSGKLSGLTVQYLRSQGFVEPYNENPEKMVAGLMAMPAEGEDRQSAL